MAHAGPLAFGLAHLEESAPIRGQPVVDMLLVRRFYDRFPVPADKRKYFNVGFHDLPLRFVNVPTVVLPLGGRSVRAADQSLAAGGESAGSRALAQQLLD